MQHLVLMIKGQPGNGGIMPFELVEDLECKTSVQVLLHNKLAKAAKYNKGQ